jgi:8-oxo-dGTP diphosphatase
MSGRARGLDPTYKVEDSTNMSNENGNRKAGTHSDAGWPKAAASVAVFRGSSVLIAERAMGPRAGLWSLPGGHIEPGETAAAAALRELTEETGVTAALTGLVDVHDVILRDPDGRLTVHYLLAVYAARWVSGEPAAASDSRQARFVRLADLSGYNLTPGALGLIERAAEMVS